MAKEHVENACGCVVIPATGEYLALCEAHAHLKDHPIYGEAAAHADVEGDRG